MEINVLLLLISFVTGALTLLAPCVFTFLPVILNGVDAGDSRRRVITILLSLGVSITLFTLLLKYSTTFVSVPISFWEKLSGLILIFQGLVILFPTLWAKVSLFFKLDSSNELLNRANKSESVVMRDILIGMSLGPIFSSCSPTYAYIVAIMLPVSFTLGSIYLLTYVFGLLSLLYLISIFGNSFLKRFVNPKGFLKQLIGYVVLIMGIVIFFGIHKEIESYIINYLPFLDLTRIDNLFLRKVL